jgi:hypothetical protein
MARILRIDEIDILQWAQEIPTIETNLGNDPHGTLQEIDRMIVLQKLEDSKDPHRRNGNQKALLREILTLSMNRPIDGTSSTGVLWQKQK